MHIGMAQNKHNKQCVEDKIKKMLASEKKIKINELTKIGYEYNEGIHTLLTFGLIIPYDFILYCLLMEDQE